MGNAMSNVGAWMFNRGEAEEDEEGGMQGGSALTMGPNKYKMAHTRRGTAILIHHETFTHKAPRLGTTKDATDLHKQLTALEFDVHAHHDLTYEELKRELNKMSKEDYTDADCLVIAISTHGDPGFLHASDQRYPVKELWSDFGEEKCPSLAGKPKIIFIQTCRGEQADSEVGIDGVTNFVVPIHPVGLDVLISYSTVENYYSWPNTSTGSWYIQVLCEEIHFDGHDIDLCSLLVHVHRRIRDNYEYYMPDREMLWSTPVMISTLRGSIYIPKRCQ